MQRKNHLERRLEIARIELAEAEAKKLKAETSAINRPKAKKSFFETYSGVGGLILAAVGVGTLFMNLAAQIGENNQRHKIEISDAIANLSSEDAISRASSISIIRPNLQDDGLGSTYLSALVIAFGTESDDQVRNMIFESFRDKQAEALLQLKILRSSKNVEAIDRLSSWSVEVDRLKQQILANEDEEAVNLTRDSVARKLDSLREAQWASIHAANAIRNLECSQGNDCPIDLSRLILRSISFAERNIDLVGADFEGAFLSGADFFEADLTGAKFDGAFLAHADFFGAKLDGSTFRNADLSLNIESPSEREVRRCVFTNGARFSGDLSKVDFDGADLSGTNLTEASITEAQLQAVTWQGSVLPTKLLNVLSYSNPPAIGENTSQKECTR